MADKNLKMQIRGVKRNKDKKKRKKKKGNKEKRKKEEKKKVGMRETED